MAKGNKKKSNAEFRKERREIRRDQKLINIQARQDEKIGQSVMDKFLPNIDAIGGTVDTSRPQDIQASLDYLQELIDMQKAGLGGLTSGELTARREEGQQEVDRNFATQLRAMARSSAARGVRGAAAQAGMRDLGRERLGAQSDLERDILIANAEVQDRRRQIYGQTLNAQFSQLDADRAAQFARQQFNANQQAKLNAGQQGLYFGGQGLNMARRDALQRYRLGKMGIQAAKEGAAAQSAAYDQLFAGLQGLASGTNFTASPQASKVLTTDANGNVIPVESGQNESGWKPGSTTYTPGVGWS